MEEILVVEDELLIGMNLSQVIENLGYETCGIASNVQAARETVEASEPEVILMDLKLEDEKEGLELTAEFKDEYDPTIIAVTSYSDPETRKEISASEMDGYLLKPVDEDDISELLETIFDEPSVETSLELDRGELF